jgi:hypothetical protein
MKRLRDIVEERNRSEVAKALAVEFRCAFVPETELPPKLAELLERLRKANTPEQARK